MKLEMSQSDYDRCVAQCGFTDSELTVLGYKRRGWYNEDIAAEMYCSSRTVKRRVRSIKQKMGIL